MMHYTGLMLQEAEHDLESFKIEINQHLRMYVLRSLLGRRLLNAEFLHAGAKRIDMHPQG
jgi:hypothetical protein